MVVYYSGREQRHCVARSRNGELRRRCFPAIRWPLLRRSCHCLVSALLSLATACNNDRGEVVDASRPSVSKVAQPRGPSELQRLEHPVLALVDGEAIPSSVLLEPLLNWYQAQLRSGRHPTAEDIRRRRGQLARQCLVEELVSREAKRRGLPEGPSDQKLLDEFTTSLSPELSLADHQERTGLSRERLVARLRAEHRLTQLVDEPKIEEKAARAWYQRHRYRFAQPERIRLRYVRLALRQDAPAAGRSSTKAVLSELISHHGLPSASQLSSAGLVHARAGEETVALEQLASPVRAWVKRATVGESSPVFEAPGALQVVRFVQRLPATTVEFEAVEKRIIGQLAASHRANARTGALDMIRAAANVKTPLVDAIAAAQQRSRAQRLPSLGRSGK